MPQALLAPLALKTKRTPQNTKPSVAQTDEPTYQAIRTDTPPPKTAYPCQATPFLLFPISLSSTASYFSSTSPGPVCK